MKTENYMKNANAQTIADTQMAASRTISDLDRIVRQMNAAAIDPQVSGVGKRNDLDTSEFVSVDPTGGGGGGGGGLAGIGFVWADGTATFISASAILENYNGEDYWSVVIGVSNNTFTKSISYDSTEEQYDGIGTNQTVYRLRVMTLDGGNEPTMIATYGQYREEIYCASGSPVTAFVKV